MIQSDNAITRSPLAHLSGTAISTAQSIILAASTRHHAVPQRSDWLAGNSFALEYAPDPHRLEIIPHHLAPYLEQEVPVRHHGYFPGWEIGSPDPGHAATATELHLRYLDTIQGLGEPHVTVHIGLPPAGAIDPGAAVDNLSRIVDYGGRLGMTISLENLRIGPTSNPTTVVDWARRSGAAITLDVGHAVSCDLVRKGQMQVTEIIDLFEDRLSEVHMYESETDCHHAPRDMRILGPIVDRLLRSSCRWWTIELEDTDELLHTRELLFAHLAENSGQPAAIPRSSASAEDLPAHTL